MRGCCGVGPRNNHAENAVCSGYPGQGVCSQALKIWSFWGWVSEARKGCRSLFAAKENRGPTKHVGSAKPDVSQIALFLGLVRPEASKDAGGRFQTPVHGAFANLSKQALEKPDSTFKLNSVYHGFSESQ